MPKNIVIFSDGTGQAGGVRPDQRLSNVYKLYRASRSGPDSSIDPALQVAFYDAGLGTDDDAAGAPTQFVRWLRKLLASVTGRGITRNIVECYQHVLDNWDEGDRIYIIGFSRGAYTARCIANLLELCGVPNVGPEGRPLARNKPEARAVAEEAVRDVYEHGAGRPAAKFDAERKELGRRFRTKYRSGDGAVERASLLCRRLRHSCLAWRARAGTVPPWAGAGFVAARDEHAHRCSRPLRVRRPILAGGLYRDGRSSARLRHQQP
jgi:hypothetical protein